MKTTYEKNQVIYTLTKEEWRIIHNRTELEIDTGMVVGSIKFTVTKMVDKRDQTGHLGSPTEIKITGKEFIDLQVQDYKGEGYVIKLER